MNSVKKLGSLALPVFVFFAYFFMYIPIIVLVMFSFNSGNTNFWEGFSLQWYHELFKSVEIIESLKNSLIVAFSAVALSLVMGLFFVFYGSKKFVERGLFFFYGSLAAPEIVLAVGLISFFSFFSVPLGLTTLIAVHTVVGMSYMTPMLYSGYKSIDKNLSEASFDLGATRGQTFIKVILPILYPAIMTSSLLVFIVSLDDFILSFFCAGASTVTLPMYIFSVIRSGATPVVNALSTLLLLATSFIVLIFVSLRARTKLF